MGEVFARLGGFTWIYLSVARLAALHEQAGRQVDRTDVDLLRKGNYIVIATLAALAIIISTLSSLDSRPQTWRQFSQLVSALLPIDSAFSLTGVKPHARNPPDTFNGPIPDLASGLRHRYERKPMRILLSLILLVVASILISACGGGSSTPKAQRPATPMGPPPSPPPSPPPKPACIETFQEGCLTAEKYNEQKEAAAEALDSDEAFQTQWGLSAIKADYGMAHLWLMRGVQFDEPENYPGAGVTVGIIDTGIDEDHPSFGGVEVSETILDGDGDLLGNIEAWAQANAQEKTIMVRAAGNSNEDTLCHIGSDNCIGSDRTDSQGNPAGSLNATSPSIDAGATAYIEELRGHTITVVATNEEGDIADFSNRCRIAADWCLAAPGEDIRIAYFGPDLNTGLWGSRNYPDWDGTSFAAPMVSGGLALMKHFFRDQMSNTELVTRLFATADKSDQYSERLIYGQGLMDLDAALSPVGNPSVSSGNTVVGRGIPMAATQLRSGGALGDGLARSVAGQQIAGFDDLGAPFWFDLGSFTSAAPGPTPSSRLRDLMPPQPIRVPLQMNRNQMAYTRADTGRSTWELGLFERLRGAHKGHFSLVEDAMTVRFMGHRGLEATAYATAADRAGRPQASGITLSLPLSNAPLRLRGGWIAERESLLGTVAKGALGGYSTNTAFFGIEAHTMVGGWHLAANAEVGRVSSTPHGGLITDLSNMATSAVSLKATKLIGKRNVAQLSVSQPLRVEQGQASLSVPIGRMKDGRVIRESLTGNLTPTGRQIDLSAVWKRHFAYGSELLFGATLTHDLGHSTETKPELSLLSSCRWWF